MKMDSPSGPERGGSRMGDSVSRSVGHTTTAIPHPAAPDGVRWARKGFSSCAPPMSRACEAAVDASGLGGGDAYSSERLGSSSHTHSKRGEKCMSPPMKEEEGVAGKHNPVGLEDTIHRDSWSVEMPDEFTPRGKGKAMRTSLSPPMGAPPSAPPSASPFASLCMSAPVFSSMGLGGVEKVLPQVQTVSRQTVSLEQVCFSAMRLQGAKAECVPR